MYKKSTIKINLTGGLVSPTELLNILDTARKTGVDDLHFGARQQLLLSVHQREIALFTRKMQEAAIAFQSDMDEKPNITSSFAFTDIFQNNEGWVSEGVYLDVFSLFDYKPTLKINICDSHQSHAPFFTGHINFISSDVPHFWFCYVRFPKSNTIERFGKLIYTQDIAVFAKQLEQFLQKNAGEIAKTLFALFDTEGVIYRQIDTDLAIPRFVMPYYEGVNRQSDGKMWLGIYRRNEDFSVKFLTEMCELCEETRIGNISITNWRSFIVKGISTEDRLKWEKLLGKHGINVRHANNELNWQIEDDAPKGASLKRYLVKQLDDMDLRTFGLVFAIKTRHKSEVFGSVIIRREPFFRFGKWEFDCFGLLASYDIFYAHDFNPHSRKRKTFRAGIPRLRLAEDLRLLSQKYYKEVTSEKKKIPLSIEKTKENDLKPVAYHRCKDCWTVYAPENGQNTEGSAFADLPETYECPTCAASKNAFELMA